MFNQVAKGEMLMDLPTSNFYIWLVVLSILKNDGVRQWVSDDNPYIMENKSHAWNHQADQHYTITYLD